MSYLQNRDFLIEVRKGNIPGHSIVQKFGRNTGVPNGSWEGILQALPQFPWLTAETTVRIQAGGNAADDAAGVGVRSVWVQGIDIAGVPQSEEIITAGASASASTTANFFRVYRAYCGDVGTYGGNNTGDIIIENTAGTQDLILIAAGEGQTQFCGFTIPSGKTGYLLSALVEVDASKAADFRLLTRENADTVVAPFSPARLKFFWDGVLGNAPIQPRSPLLKLQGMTDVWIEAYGGGAATEVTADMEILLVDD